MNKFDLKKSLSALCAVALMACMCIPAFAVNMPENDSAVNLIIGNMTQNLSGMVSDVPVLQGVNNHNNLNTPTSTNGTSFHNEEVFSCDGSISDGTTDFHIIQVPSDKTAFLKIISEDNANLAALVVELDMNTGVLGNTVFGDLAQDNLPAIETSLSAGAYAIAVLSGDSSSPDGDYTLMWNSSNPSGATALLHCANDLSKVILGYSSTVAVYCNGTSWLNNLEWEEHYTFASGNGYVGRDQSVSSITVRNVNIGSYSSNLGTTSNALFVEVGVGTLWTIMRSQFVNNTGDVTHIMDYSDATGQITPRRFDSADIENGPHYIVIDMNTNNVIDFLSAYNYLWLTGQNTGLSISFTATNVLGQ